MIKQILITADWTLNEIENRSIENKQMKNKWEKKDEKY